MFGIHFVDPIMPGTRMVRLGRQELDVWLGEPDDFVLAVLRDIYSCDSEVARWLNTPRLEFGGQTAVDMISAGRKAEVEVALIQEWNTR